MSFSSARRLCCLLVLIAPGCDRSRPAGAEFPTPTQFHSESLGVAVTLPDVPDWSFRQVAWSVGQPRVSAVNKKSNARFDLFVSLADRTLTLDDVIDRRRAQFATLFGVTDFDLCIANVFRDERRQLDRVPVMQYQAVTKPLIGPDKHGSQAAIFWIAMLHNGRGYEGVAMLSIPIDGSDADQLAIERDADTIAGLLGSIALR